MFHIIPSQAQPSLFVSRLTLKASTSLVLGFIFQLIVFVNSARAAEAPTATPTSEPTIVADPTITIAPIVTPDPTTDPSCTCEEPTPTATSTPPLPTATPTPPQGEVSCLDRLFNTSNNALLEALGECNPCKEECSACGENNELCFGCDDVLFSGKVVDACGVCGGDGSQCAGCDGVPNSGKVYDQCEECGGNNSCFGCDNKPNSGLVVDSCGVCGGDNSSCLGCDGVPNSGKTIDRCGVCGGNNACMGCDNIPFSGKTLDVCGICGGDGKSCAGCDGVPNSKVTFDICGVCGGNGTSCAGCDGVPGSRQRLDSCGVCGGDGSSCAPRPSDCTSKNMMSLQAQLDGAAHLVANVGRGVLKAYVRYAPNKRTAQQYANRVLSQVRSLETQTWANAWALPYTIVSCPASANCIAISTESGKNRYESTLTSLRASVYGAILDLQKFKQRAARNSAKENLKRLDREYAAGLTLLKEYPASNNNCGTQPQ